MALAHACIAVLPHLGGETCEKDDDDEAGVAEGGGGGVRGAGCEQETEEEEDAGGRVVDVAGAKVMGISFLRVCRLRVYVSSSLDVGELFSGDRVSPSRFSIRPFTRIAERASLWKVYYNRSREERIVSEMIFF